MKSIGFLQFLYLKQVTRGYLRVLESLLEVKGPQVIY